MHLTLNGLTGQQRAVAKALLEHGYLDKEYALLNLKIRSVSEIVSRLRRKGWPIETNVDRPERLYTLSRSVRQDVRLITSAITQAVDVGNLDAAINGAETLKTRLKNAKKQQNRRNNAVYLSA